MAEVPGIPAAGPIDLASLKVELADGSASGPYAPGAGPYDARLTRVVDSVNSFVRELPIAGRSLTYGSPPPVWPPRVVGGSLMLASRLWRRKDSPAGIEAFTDAGAVYVSRNDPDIAMLLELGNYTRPALG